MKKAAKYTKKQFLADVQALFKRGLYYDVLPNNLVREGARKVRLSVGDFIKADQILRDLYHGRFATLQADIQWLMSMGLIRTFTFRMVDPANSSVDIKFSTQGRKMADMLYGKNAVPVIQYEHAFSITEHFCRRSFVKYMKVK